MTGPLAAVTGRSEIMDAVHGGGLGGTFGGNPLSCAAALGTIATIETEDLRDRARRVAEVALPRLRGLAKGHRRRRRAEGPGSVMRRTVRSPW